ncbi:MAG: transcription antitermination factor NusB, partial [Parvularculaceae bacterium]
TLKRLDATARAILRAGIFELIRRPDVPYRVVIDEYVELANNFFDEGTTEASFINGVLDSAAKDVRSDEIS